MTIITSKYLTDGTALVMLDEDTECSVCHRATPWIAVPRGGPVMCWTCEKPDVGARLLPDGPNASPERDNGGPRAASSHDEWDALAFALRVIERPRAKSFADVPASEICRGTPEDRLICNDGAGRCPREFNCFD